jgi:hypothetical protein
VLVVAVAVGVVATALAALGGSGDRPAAAVLLAAGDIAECDQPGDEATARLLAEHPTATIAALGDLAYQHGTPEEFRRCFGPSWGRFRNRIRPAAGNHDHATENAGGYLEYFGVRAGPAGLYRYSYDLGAWHVVVLNAVCGGAASGCSVPTQITWLRSDLAAHPNSCTLALMSAPRFSSGSVHGNNTSMQTYWGELAQAGVEFVMSGDDHDYERFAAMNAAGQADPNGMRQWVVGSGGRSHYPFVPDGVVRANSEVREDATYGILRLVLRAGAYEWEFIPEAGKSFVDSGSETCH